MQPVESVHGLKKRMQVLYSTRRKKRGGKSFGSNPDEPVERILNRITSRVCYGKQVGTGIVHCNTKQHLKWLYQREIDFLTGITYRKWDEHFRGEQTYYFTGSTGTDETLFMIDIDCHQSGSLQGAVEAAEYLRKNYFPGLFFETSTNGKGIHCYAVLRKTGKSALEVNTWLKALQSALMPLNTMFAIELVEIKGTLHQLVMDGRTLLEVTCGQLAKCPRTARDRKQEFVATTVVEYDTFVMPVLKAPDPGKMSIKLVATKPKKSLPGSAGGKCIQSPEPLLPLARQIIGDHKYVRVDGVVVRAEDVAILLAILFFCGRNLNADGTMPTARIKAFWEAMYESGDIERAWCAQRYSRARNLIEKASGIKWTSNEYCLQHACKWHLSEDVIEAISGLMGEGEEKRTTFVSTLISPVLVFKSEQEMIKPELRIERRITYEEVERYLKAA